MIFDKDVAMSTVVALGHTFDLEIERTILSGAGITLIDGRDGYDPAIIDGVLLGTAAKLDAEAISVMPRLRGVMRYGIGYDNIDVGAASAAGATVGIVRDYCVEEVAEHALTGALTLLRALPHWDRNVRAGQWRAGPRPRHRRISRLTFGIMGYGLIGRALAKKTSALFGFVRIYDPWLNAPAGVVDGFKVEADFETFLGSVDALSLHVPLTPDTRGIIGATSLGHMRPDAVLVNASRGGLVDEEALDRALRDGRLAGAALDTFAVEPIPSDHPLLSNPSVLLSPHVAWLSEEAEIALRTSAAEDIVRMLSGERPSTPVN
jgi:D-3-phosphoglycerate dehydrogenase / 2-oxoglutarate reductase